MADVFDLSATLRLDSSQFENGLNRSEGKAGSFGNSLKSGLANAAKIGAAALGAATTAIGALTKSAVSGFAEQQQLIGGVQKLYGNMGMSVEEYAQSVGRSVDEVKNEWSGLEKAQNLVLDNARNAYKTAGISANQYMDMATSFSAALINSLGGDTMKAAEATDVAMRAMSDNWNTFGGDLGMIQGAFQGFAKQNYTMLDNLKLGYGGTKTEMERLISDANEYAKSIGQASDLSIDSFADIVTAIDLVQQKQNVAGTTAREAATTVSGSMGMIKAAWQNLMSGLADSEADIDSLMKYVVDSAEVAFSNVMPVIEKALSSISSLIEKVAPMISEKVPGLVQKILPSLLSAATSLITGVLRALPSLLKVLIQQIPVIMKQLVSAVRQTLPEFLQAGKDLITTLTNGMTPRQLLDKAVSMISQFINKLFEYLPKLLEMGTNYVTKMIEGIGSSLPVLIEKGGELLEQFVSKLLDYLPKVMESGIQIVEKLISGIDKSLPNIIKAITNVLTKLISTILKKLPDFLAKGAELVVKIAQGIAKSVPTIIKELGLMVSKLRDQIKNSLPEFLKKGGEIILNMLSGLKNAQSQLLNSLWNIIKSAISGIGNYFGQFTTKGREIISKIASGITGAIGTAISAIGSLISRIISTIAGRLGSFVTQGSNVVGRIASGISGAVGRVTSAISSIISRIKSAFNISWSSIGSNIINGIKSGISGAAGRLASTAVSAARSAFSSMKNALGIASPSKLARDEIGKNIALGIGVGFEKFMPTDDMIGTVEDAFDRISSMEGPVVGATTGKSQSDVISILNEIIKSLRDLAGMGIYMDGKTLVGELVPAMDTAFGRQVSYKGRGIL